MNRLTAEWIDKAEEDYQAATVLHDAEQPMHGAVCFHAQQCVEKYMKAVLHGAGTAVPRTHDLVELLEIGERLMPEMVSLESELDALTTYAVAARYPGRSASPERAQAAVELMSRVRSVLRLKLGLA